MTDTPRQHDTHDFEIGEQVRFLDHIDVDGVRVMGQGTVVGIYHFPGTIDIDVQTGGRGRLYRVAKRPWVLEKVPT